MYTFTYMSGWKVFSESCDDISKLDVEMIFCWQNFWQLAKKFTHSDVVSQLNHLGQITSEVGMCRVSRMSAHPMVLCTFPGRV